MESKDGEVGRTTLSWAVEGGHETIVKLLLETGKVDVDSSALAVDCISRSHVRIKLNTCRDWRSHALKLFLKCLKSRTPISLIAVHSLMTLH
jgi:hypothetical protein